MIRCVTVLDMIDTELCRLFFNIDRIDS